MVCRYDVHPIVPLSLSYFVNPRNLHTQVPKMNNVFHFGPKGSKEDSNYSNKICLNLWTLMMPLGDCQYDQ